MKRSYNSLFIALTAGFALPVAAQQQQDSTLTREMTIEKEYNPIVRDADKITRMPEVETPTANKTKIVYAQPTLDTRVKPELQTLEVGSVNTSYPFSKKKGYLTLGGGNYLNLRGDFGYRFLDTDKDILGIELSHSSSNGKIEFLEESWGKTKRKVNDNHVKLYYTHGFENLILHTHVTYEYAGFNYYGGSPLLENNGDSIRNDQTQQRLAFDFSLNSRQQTEWDYKMLFGFTSFSQEMPGINENMIRANMGLSKNSPSNWRFGMDLDAKVLVYGGDSDKYGWITKNSFKNSGLISLQPGFKYDNGDGISAKLGIHADFAFGKPPYVGVAPDMNLKWKFASNWLFYSGLTGGIHQYSLDEMTKQNRYYYMDHQLRNSYTIADLNLGLRTNSVAGFEFDLYGGAGYTTDALFEYTHVTGLTANGRALIQNAVGGFVADAFNWNVGFKMKYKFSDVVDMHLKLQKNGWNLKDNQQENPIASYKPGFEVAWGATIRPTKKLLFDLKYDFLGDREAVVQEEYLRTPVVDTDLLSSGASAPFLHLRQNVAIKDIHRLDIKTTYLFNDTFSAYCSLNNLLFRRQEMWYGMPEQGFHFMIGGSVRF
ncbi:MAG: hypothetical protein RR346_04745 [Bacteroidales bacterium]